MSNKRRNAPKAIIYKHNNIWKRYLDFISAQTYKITLSEKKKAEEKQQKAT